MANPSPAITFSVSLTPFNNEAFGPATHAVTVGMPVLDSNAENVRSTYLPGLTAAKNRIVKHHGGIFTEYGQKAIYLRNMYAVGYAPADRAYLTVESVD